MCIYRVHKHDTNNVHSAATTLCLSIISFAIHAGGPDSLIGFSELMVNPAAVHIKDHVLYATRAIPASCASRVSSPAMTDLLTAGEQKHKRTTAVKKVKMNTECMTMALRSYALPHSTRTSYVVRREERGGVKR